jgi:hypothetical protein
VRPPAAEADTAPGAALDRVAELEGELAARDARLAALAESLAAANAEAAEARQDYRQLRLRVEALGIAALDDDPRAVEQRLLNALNDLRLAQEENETLMERLLSLSEAAIEFKAAAANIDPSALRSLEGEIARASQGLGIAQNDSPLARSLRPAGDPSVVSLKPELGLVVVGAGERDGMRVGTPLRLFRGEQPVATAIVVDVRHKVAGALLTANLAGGEQPVRVGDTARPDVHKPSSSSNP